MPVGCDADEISRCEQLASERANSTEAEKGFFREDRLVERVGRLAVPSAILGGLFVVGRARARDQRQEIERQAER